MLGFNFINNLFLFLFLDFSVSKSVIFSLRKLLFSQFLTDFIKNALIFLIILSSESFEWFAFKLFSRITFFFNLPLFFWTFVPSTLFSFSFSLSKSISFFFLLLFFFLVNCIFDILSISISGFLNISCNLLVISSFVVITGLPFTVL